MRLLPTLLVLACLAPAPAAGDPPNLLLVLFDDMGVDMVGAYGEHPEAARTPTLDALAADGVLFRNAWASPSCSPGRATLITGRHGFRTGIGRPVVSSPQFTDPDGLPLSEVTLPELLADTHTSLAVGKWHLSIQADPLTGPLDQGFAHHRGSFANLSNTTLGPQYFEWVKANDGVVQPDLETTYATSDSVDDALELIGQTSEPWFLYLSLHAPHGPLHAPPAALHTYGDLPADVEANADLYVKAMIEAADTELARLLASLDPAVLADTLVVVTSDNGTFSKATTAPFDPEHAKGTIYEGGLNVPLIVNGPGVVAGESAALVHLTDVYATFGELAGATPVGGDDSLSLVPYLGDPDLPSLRSMVYAEDFTPNGLGAKASWCQALRSSRFKLVRIHEAPVASPTREELYDLAVDPFETTNLLDGPGLTPLQQTAYDELGAGLRDLLGAWKQAGDGVPGVQGLPVLTGTGTLEPNTPAAVSIEGGPPGGTAFLVVGVGTLYLPFKGGLMVPAPSHFVIVPLDGLGRLDLVFGWPANLPPGFDIWWQSWHPDPAGPVGFSATNALVCSTP